MPTRATAAQYEPLLTITEVANALRVSKMTIYRLVHDGQLPSMRIGKSLRVPVSGLDAFLSQVGGGFDTSTSPAQQRAATTGQAV